MLRKLTDDVPPKHVVPDDEQYHLTPLVIFFVYPEKINQSIMFSGKQGEIVSGREGVMIGPAPALFLFGLSFGKISNIAPFPRYNGLFLSFRNASTVCGLIREFHQDLLEVMVPFPSAELLLHMVSVESPCTNHHLSSDSYIKRRYKWAPVRLGLFSRHVRIVPV